MSSGTRRWWLSVVGSALLLNLMSACGSSQPGSNPAGSKAATSDVPSQSKESETMPVKDTVFGDMAGTMDRARSVEKTEMEHKEALDRAIDQNAGSAPAE